MIETYQLGKQFGSFQAVQNLSLTIQPGEVLALLGPNGAGKTTTVRMLGAILKPTTGWARICGHDVVTESRLIRSKVGLLTEYPGLYGRMRAVEYLSFFGALQGLDPQRSQQQAEKLLHQFGLWEAHTKRLDSYSKGMKQKIALVRALLHEPPVLFLDEPTTAMDPQSARMVRDAIAAMRATDRAILLTTHNLPEAEELADRIAILRSGQIIIEGTFEELTQKLLGEPLWEARFAQPYPNLGTVIEHPVQIEEIGTDFLRYRCPNSRQLNPQLIAHFAAQGLDLISLTETPRSLEDVYLRIVADQATSPFPLLGKESEGEKASLLTEGSI